MSVLPAVSSRGSQLLSYSENAGHIWSKLRVQHIQGTWCHKLNRREVIFLGSLSIAGVQTLMNGINIMYDEPKIHVNESRVYFLVKIEFVNNIA